MRASPQTALLRIDVAGLDGASDDAVLRVQKANEPERSLEALPTPPIDGPTRYSFALPPGLRVARLTLVVGDVELPVAVPPERSRQDAVAGVALREARARLAALERELAAGRPPEEGPAGDGQRERLEQQLAEHRLLRSQLARELQTAREKTQEIEEELRRAELERARLAEELDNERQGSVSERDRLTERLQQAHARVEYLERRVVEVQGQSARPDGA